MTEKIELSSNVLLVHAKALEKVMQRAVREALLGHKRAGNPIAVWRDGQVVVIPPEEIPGDEEGVP
jgi:hypothetical protein